MSGPRLTFEKIKFILKCYWKDENLAEVQKQYRRKFQEDPPMLLTINRIKDKFERNGTVEDVHRQRSGRPRERQRGSPAKKEYWKVIAKHPKQAVKLPSANQVSSAF
ncbi:hypothetical protein AVEN_206261-1 [Araneus ventricosus]|uniref:DUF4817 domain-containing protein n=1 Tax=Araneus ventricosus TaxID=182803 RepID=A0A4Y2R4T7_ARAVE|nr:hypothetical protein AVEN_206261-1 [Araneus ventricosus]